jgi:hypothetical protein
MSRLLFVLALLSLLVASVSTVSAQDEESVPCTEEELALTSEALTLYGDGLSTLQEDYDLSVDASDAAYGETLLALDAISYEFWNTVYPELPTCAEAQVLAYSVGSIYDEYLTIGLLDNMAAWLEASGDSEGAAAFSEQSAARSEDLAAAMEEMSGMTMDDLAASMSGEELEACTEEEVTALGDGVNAGMTEISTAIADMESDPTLTFGITEGASYAFDSEVFDEVATCQENFVIAWLVSASLHEINIIAGLSANATMEAGGGNTDVGQSMADSAVQRLTDFQEEWADMMGEETA